MNRYWTRIGLGALLVFCVGLTGMVAVRKAKAEVGSLLGTAVSRLPRQLAHLPFRLHGRQIGEVTGIDVVRNSPGELGTVTIRVAMAGEAQAAELGECQLTANDLERWNSRTGFRCAEEAEIAADLVRVGDVIFQPGDLSRALYLPSHATDRWRHAGIRRLTASLVTDRKGGVTAQGHFDLQDGQRGAERGSFQLQADEGGAIISVRDEGGRALLDFRADRNGLNLSFKDRQGRNLLKMLVDSLGAALKVHH